MHKTKRNDLAGNWLRGEAVPRGRVATDRANTEDAQAGGLVSAPSSSGRLSGARDAIREGCGGSLGTAERRAGRGHSARPRGWRGRRAAEHRAPGARASHPAGRRLLPEQHPHPASATTAATTGPSAWRPPGAVGGRVPQGGTALSAPRRSPPRAEPGGTGAQTPTPAASPLCARGLRACVRSLAGLPFPS